MEKIILNRETLFLKKGEIKNITLPSLIQSDNTIFQIEYSAHDVDKGDKIIKFKVYNSSGHVLSISRVIDRGITKFDLHVDLVENDEYQFVDLTSNYDMIIAFSVIEYQGTGIDL